MSGRVRIAQARELGEFSPHRTSLGLCEPGEGDAVLHRSPPVDIEDETKRTATGGLAKGVLTSRRKEDHAGGADVEIGPVGRHHTAPAQVAEHLGEGVRMARELVHLGQVTVQP